MHGELLFGVLLIGVISFDVVPGIELEHIVFLFQVTRPELKRVAPLLVVLRIVRSMWSVDDLLLLLVLCYLKRGHISSELLSLVDLNGARDDWIV